MRVDGLKRHASSRLKAEEPDPDPPAKKKKVVKVHARNSTAALKKQLPLSEQTSQQSSPAPFSRSHKASPLPIKSNDDVVEEGQSLRSIAESGVLAASLARSRSKWLSEGIFERYWVKSSGYRKKGAPEIPANNPLPSTMQKLGACQMIAEPHVFEVVLYTIKDPVIVQTPALVKNPVYAGVGSPSLAAARPCLAPYNQHTYGNTGNAKPNITPSQGPLQSAWSPALQPRQQAQMVLPAPAPAPRLPQPGPTSQSSAASQPPQKSPAISTPTSAKPAQSTTNRPTPASQPAAPAQPAAKPAQDPVIQMLAQRASVNPELKVLMKIVASGQADKSQLANFQGHIDELTNILKGQNQSQTQTQSQPQRPNQNQNQNRNQNQARPQPQSKAPQYQVPSSQVPRTQTQSPQPLHQHQPFSQTPSRNLSPLSYPHTHPQNQQPAYRPPLKPTSPAPLPKPPQPIRGIALEFTSPESGGDRYRLPAHTLLSYQPYGRLVTASFLVVRKGDDSRPDFLSKQSYHQPVTVTFSCANPRVLEPLVRGVEEPEKAKEAMRETMSKTKRVPSTTLALRLPAPPDDGNSNNNNNITSAGTATDTPTLDRRTSLIRPHAPTTTTPMRNSPGLEPPSAFSTSKKKAAAAAAAEEAMCRYCFDYLSAWEAAPFAAAAELPVCKSCGALRAKNAAVRDEVHALSVRRVEGLGGMGGRVARPAGRGDKRVLMFA